MKIVIAGGTGFLGTPLTAALAGRGHQLVLLSRGNGPASPHARTAIWTPDGSVGPWASEIEGADVVVNLAGESIAQRWTASRRQRIVDSRVNATRSLVNAIVAARETPKALINGSAVGYYGPTDDTPITEAHPPGADFLASVCVQWEAEAMRAGNVTRVVRVRTGIVLERNGGALPQMLPPFWLFAGGPVGSGRQYWPWIHRQDWVDLVRFSIETPDVTGAINATAPNPVPNRDFARALGRALHRPAVMPAPGFMLKLLLGDMAEGLLLSGQRAVPAAAQRAGFTFAYPHLDPALGAIFGV